jgi:hypothetical protein
MNKIEYNFQTALLMVSGATTVPVSLLKEDEKFMEILSTQTYQDAYDYVEENY